MSFSSVFTFPETILGKRRSSTANVLFRESVRLRSFAKKLEKQQLGWNCRPRHIMIVAKPDTAELCVRAAFALLEMGFTVYIQDRIKDLVNMEDVVSSPEAMLCQSPDSDSTEFNIDQLKTLKFWDESFESTPEAEQVDLVITFGGDGTVLYAASLFQKTCPPILPFNLGSVGFLTLFNYERFKDTISSFIDRECTPMNVRTRFECTIHRESKDTADHLQSFQVLNDVVIDRGQSSFLSQLELYGNESFITQVQADGLIISTPTGSTAYSLSAGGSLVHPQVSAILVTPICPHTLSFRPMILPDTMDIRITIPQGSRSSASVSFDGRHPVELFAGDSLTVSGSNHPVSTISLENQSTDWFNGLETSLGWNSRKTQKPLNLKF